MTQARPRTGWLFAALIALAMLSYAVVRSTVMQVAMASPASEPSCGEGMAMDATAMTGAAGRHAPAKPAPKKTCPYCAAAAHPPLVVVAFAVPTPTAVVFSPTPRVAVQGPRGPPAFRPRARGPPSPLL